MMITSYGLQQTAVATSKTNASIKPYAFSDELLLLLLLCVNTETNAQGIYHPGVTGTHGAVNDTGTHHKVRPEYICIHAVTITPPSKTPLNIEFEKARSIPPQQKHDHHYTTRFQKEINHNHSNGRR